MSSEGRDSTGAPGLVPKLRFPEFRGAGSWTRRTLGAYLHEHTGRVAASTEIPVYSSSRSGLTPQEEYFDGSNLQNSGEYSVVPEGYITFRHMSDDGTFKFNQNLTGGKIAVSKEYPVFTAEGISRPFLLNILNNSYDFRTFALSQKKGGTRTRLYLSALRTWEPLLPPDEGEQHKIAECLSSLDDVIAAERDKLAALKDHKTGLMQALFPAPGQTTPHLRFPKFDGAGEWMKGNLRALCSMKAGNFIAAAEIEERKSNGMFPCFGGNGLRGYTRGYTHSGRYPVIGRQGALCGNVNLADGHFYATEHAIVADPRNGISADWLYYALHYLKLNRFATGQAQPGLSVETLNAVECPIPPTEAEQVQISSCLGTLDSMVSIQSEHIEMLKTHKAALTQQLFPAPEPSA